MRKFFLMILLVVTLLFSGMSILWLYNTENAKKYIEAQTKAPEGGKATLSYSELTIKGFPTKLNITLTEPKIFLQDQKSKAEMNIELDYIQVSHRLFGNKIAMSIGKNNKFNNSSAVSLLLAFDEAPQFQVQFDNLVIFMTKQLQDPKAIVQKIRMVKYDAKPYKVSNLTDNKILYESNGDKLEYALHKLGHVDNLTLNCLFTGKRNEETLKHPLGSTTLGFDAEADLTYDRKDKDHKDSAQEIAFRLKQSYFYSDKASFSISGNINYSKKTGNNNAEINVKISDYANLIAHFHELELIKKPENFSSMLRQIAAAKEKDRDISFLISYTNGGLKIGNMDMKEILEEYLMKGLF
jgi:hypothetical protein